MAWQNVQLSSCLAVSTILPSMTSERHLLSVDNVMKENALRHRINSHEEYNVVWNGGTRNPTQASSSTDQFWNPIP
jgi:hypothetical protein